MAKQRIIEIIIDQDGQSSIDLQGYMGKGCADVSAQITKALGGKVIQSDKKTEFFKKDTKVKQKLNRGF